MNALDLYEATPSRKYLKLGDRLHIPALGSEYILATCTVGTAAAINLETGCRLTPATDVGTGRRLTREEAGAITGNREFTVTHWSAA